MLKPRTVFREEGEDDVTMTTMDATIDHIMYSQVNSFHNKLHFECIKNMTLLNDENIYIYLFRSEQHVWTSIWMLNKPVVVHHEMKIKSSTFWNPIRPPDKALTSNGRQIYIRAPFQAHEYLMERFRSPLSNGSSLIAKFHPSHPQSRKQGAASPVMGLWACNFIWDPGPRGAQGGCAPTWWSTTLGNPRTSSHSFK